MQSNKLFLSKVKKQSERKNNAHNEVKTLSLKYWTKSVKFAFDTISCLKLKLVRKNNTDANEKIKAYEPRISIE